MCMLCMYASLYWFCSSFGMVLYELFSNRVPYEGRSQFQIIADAVRKKHFTFTAESVNTDEDLVNLIRECVEQNYEDYEGCIVLSIVVSYCIIYVCIVLSIVCCTVLCCIVLSIVVLYYSLLCCISTSNCENCTNSTWKTDG